ncbi:MAG: SMC family ATPase [Chloroflexota bacterium]|nr:SMC family ATPase [Chloroflexota bacterium]
MIPVRLSLRNFMCYREASLSFEGIHVACLCGNNGDGKSTLLDAMTWALWGRARARTDDELIHLGMTDMDVEFEFAVGRERYRIIRKRSKGKARRAGQSLLDLQVAAGDGFRSISGDTIRQTERKIIDTLRMDYDTFVNSAYLLQGRADEFTKKEPARRKQVLADILGLSRYDDLEERARESARRKDREVRDIDVAVAQIDTELADKGAHEADLRDISEEIAKIEDEWREKRDRVSGLEARRHTLELRGEQREDIESRIKQAGETIGSFKGLLQEHRKRIERYEAAAAAYEKETEEARAHLAELAAMQDEIEGKRSEQQEASNKGHYLATTNEQLKREMLEFKDKIDMLAAEEAACPLCGTELGVDGRDRIMESYRSQGIEKKELFRTNEEEKNRLESRLKALKQDIDALDGRVREGRERWAGRAEMLDRDYREAQAALPQEREALAKTEEELKRWCEALDAEVKRRDTYRAELEAAPELEADLGAASRELEELTGTLEQRRQSLGSARERLERCAVLERSRGEKVAAKESASRDRQVYEELARAFGKKGIQAMLIENALPEIEEEANRLLARMTDGRMSVSIESQRAAKSREGEAIETLDINIGDELGTRRYELYSGGEAFRIDFALRIALSKLLARRAGAPLPTLIVDEGFGSQDTGGRERLVEAINSIQDDFEKILVITHINEMKESFPVRIEVSKGPDGSRVEVS